ncbi:MAG: TonB-dependent receptor, partial [Pseudomonadota bacterium]
GTDEFRGVPGVFFRRGEGDGEEFPFISIRGVTGNHGNDTFLALVDGIPFVGPDEEVFLYEVPYPIVDQIEIVRGPVSALYGRGAIAGAVNYQTRTPSEDSNEFSLSAGSDDYYRGQALMERTFDNDAGFIASVSYEDFEGWRENSARETTSVFLKGVLPVDDRSALTGWITYFDREAEVPSAIPTLADGTVVDVFGGTEGFLGQKPTRNNVTGWIGALRYDREISDNLSLQITGQARSFDTDVRLNFYDLFEFDPDNTIMGVNGFASVNDAKIYFGEALVNWRGGKHNIVAGVSAERTTLDEEDRWTGEIDPFFTGECGFRFYAILIDYSTGEVLNDTPDNDCFVREQLRTAADTTNTFYGAFIQDEISLTERLTLTLGVRYDAFEREIDFFVVGTQPVDQMAEGDADAFAPKATLAYDFGDSLLYASYGRGFNSNFGPIFQWEPERFARDEAPTTIDSYEIGWKGQTADRMLTWETAIFYLLQEDRRIFISNPDPMGPPTLATTGREYSSRGFEGSVTLRPTDQTSLLFNYTYLDPEWDDLILQGSFGAPDTDFSGNKPQGVPENIFFAEATHDFTPWLTGRASYEWYDDYFVDLANTVEEGQYDVVNFSATLTPPNFDNVSVDLSVTNLLDEEYFFFFGGSNTSSTLVTPGVPRQVRLTLRAKF